MGPILSESFLINHIPKRKEKIRTKTTWKRIKFQRSVKDCTKPSRVQRSAYPFQHRDCMYRDLIGVVEARAHLEVLQVSHDCSIAKISLWPHHRSQRWLVTLQWLLGWWEQPDAARRLLVKFNIAPSNGTYFPAVDKSGQRKLSMRWDRLHPCTESRWYPSFEKRAYRHAWFWQGVRKKKTRDTIGSVQYKGVQGP